MRIAGKLASGLGLVFALTIQSSAWATTWYVAAGGSGDGTAAAPFGTIQAAANAANAGDLVLVAPGIYRETVRVLNSGTAQAPIVFSSLLPGAAVVSGTNPVGPFQPNPAGAGWTATLPAFVSSLGQGEQCFSNGTRLIEARWPYTPPQSLSSPAFDVVSAVLSDVAVAGSPEPYLQKHQAVIKVDDLPAGNWQGAGIHLLLGYGYQQVTGQVVASQPGQLTITYLTRLGDTVMPYSQFFLFGSAAAFTQAGEWLLTGQNLLLRAPGDVNPGIADIECKQRDFAFDLSGQSYVTLQGFTIFAATVTTDDVAQQIRTGSSIAAASNIALDQLTINTPNSIRDLGGDPYSQWTNSSGVILSGTDNLLSNSSISDADGNGVSLAGVGNQVLYNVISDSNLAGSECAAISTGYSAGGARTYNLGEEIGYNTLQRSGRALVQISALASSTAAPSRIHHNLMSGAVLQTYDNGAIYDFQYSLVSFQDGLELDHNRISASPVGIYLDNLVNGFLVHHNLITSPGEPRLTDGAVIINGASKHLIANNTIYAELPGMYGILDSESTRDPGVVIRNNILRGPSYVGAGAVADHNLLWNGILGSPTDPLFTLLADANFALMPGSQAINAGVAISGVTNDTRSGSQAVVGLPDLGAIESATPSWVPFVLDVFAPVVTLTTPANGAIYTVGQNVYASYNCADNPGGSGVARCTGNSRNRGAVATTTPGTWSFTVNAVDYAGNTSSVVNTYTVVQPAGAILSDDALSHELSAAVAGLK